MSICSSWRTSRFPVVVYKTQVICKKSQMVSTVTRNPFLKFARKDHRAVIGISIFFELFEVIHCNGGADLNATFGFAGKCDERVAVVRIIFRNHGVFNETSNTAHILRELLATAVEHGEHVTIFLCAESSNKRFEREPLFLTFVVYHCECELVIYSVPCIVDED